MRRAITGAFSQSQGLGSGSFGLCDFRLRQQSSRQ
jgi:hypothetical protein